MLSVFRCGTKVQFPGSLGRDKGTGLMELQKDKNKRLIVLNYIYYRNTTKYSRILQKYYKKDKK